MKKILYISPQALIGGGEVSLSIILKHLNRKVYKPFLICYAEGPFVEKARSMGIETKVLKYGNFISNFRVIRGIYKFIKEEGIQLVHVNSLDIRSAIASLFSGVPCIGHLRVIFPFSWRDRLFARISRKVIAVSEVVVKEFCRNCNLQNKFVVIPNAVEVPGDLKAAPVKSQFGIPEAARIVGTAGRIDPLKGYEYFMEAAVLIKEKIPGVNFLIVGGAGENSPEEKKYLQMLKDKAEKSGIANRFHFTGFRPDVSAVMSTFDVLVVSSMEIKRGSGKTAEGFGRVAIEGFALGIPVVAFATGGLPEIIENERTGVLVPAGDSAALARAVIALLNDPEKSNSITENAKRKLNLLYSVERQMEAIGKVYAENLEIIPENLSCEICGGKQFKTKENCGGGYNVLECCECGFAFVFPKLCDNLIKELYQADYYQPWIETQRKKRVALWKRRLGILKRLLPRKGRLLDIGCAEGLFLELAKADGWEVAGTEISSFAAQYTREKLGIPVFEGEAIDSGFRGEKFDAVTIWHVLEHTRNPLEMLQAVRRLLKDDGVLILALPNLNNKISRILYRIIKGKRQSLFSWDNREPHLIFFSEKTVRLILEKSGFAVLNVNADYGYVKSSERLLNLLCRGFYLLSGRKYFESLEIHARPRL